MGPAAREGVTVVSSMFRPVPSRIPRPFYVGEEYPDETVTVHVQSAETIERMRIAGRIAADALREIGRHVEPGATTDELDKVGHEFLCDHDAYPSTLGYKGYSKSLCVSVNDVACHGVPGSLRLQEGDLCNVDITAYIHGVHGDVNTTFPVGQVAPQHAELILHTKEATRRAIHAVQPGRNISMIGLIIESYAKRHQLSVLARLALAQETDSALALEGPAGTHSVAGRGGICKTEAGLLAEAGACEASTLLPV